MVQWNPDPPFPPLLGRYDRILLWWAGRVCLLRGHSPGLRRPAEQEEDRSLRNSYLFADEPTQAVSPDISVSLHQYCTRCGARYETSGRRSARHRRELGRVRGALRYFRRPARQGDHR